jgi:hypothetical protein
MVSTAHNDNDQLCANKTLVYGQRSFWLLQNFEQSCCTCLPSHGRSWETACFLVKSSLITKACMHMRPFNSFHFHHCDLKLCGFRHILKCFSGFSNISNTFIEINCFLLFVRIRCCWENLKQIAMYFTNSLCSQFHLRFYINVYVLIIHYWASHYLIVRRYVNYAFQIEISHSALWSQFHLFYMVSTKALQNCIFRSEEDNSQISLSIGMFALFVIFSHRLFCNVCIHK